MPYTASELQRLADSVISKSIDPSRHKCFVSYHAADSDEVASFITNYGSAFIPRVIGVTDGDDFIDSDNTDYIMGRIREKYLADSTVTIVLVGRCTWARRYVDWEVYSTLRNDAVNKRSGLVAIQLSSIAGTNVALPARVSDNRDDDKGYARYWTYPVSTSSLRSMIQTAFDERTLRAALVNNTRARRARNSDCL